MAEGTKVYKSVAGFVQFDVKPREANGQTVRDVVIKPFGAPDPKLLVKVTVWPEFAAVELEKGDVVFADGLYTRSLGQAGDGGQREYHNVSAKFLTVLKGATRAEREVVQAPAAAAADGQAEEIPF